MAYRSEDKRDRWKAIAGVVLVHVVLGAAILTGLNVNIVADAVERLETFDVTLPEVPPPPPPPPPPRPAQEEQGAPAAPKASPVVAPKPEVELPVQNPIAAAPEPGTGSSSAAGQGGVGTGTGAGGTGSGAGQGGGGGGGVGFTPARITRRIPNSEYRRISGGRIPAGSATIRFIVTPQGRMRDCRVVRSSGDAQVDSVLCGVAERRMRFAPARDPSGRPVAQDMAYTPTWRPR